MLVTEGRCGGERQCCDRRVNGSSAEAGWLLKVARLRRFCRQWLSVRFRKSENGGDPRCSCGLLSDLPEAFLSPFVRYNSQNLGLMYVRPTSCSIS